MTAPLVLRWVTRYDDPAPTRNPFVMADGPPYPKQDGSSCFFHDDGLSRHSIGRLRWYLSGPVADGPVCERCAIDWLLEARAALDDAEGFRVYVEGIEASSVDRAGEHPVLARQVLAAATDQWGQKAFDTWLRGLQAATRHPARAKEVAGLLTELGRPPKTNPVMVPPSTATRRSVA